MGKKAPKVDVPDPMEIIRAETEANRTDTTTPFGSSQWEGNNQVTTLSPEMEAMRQQMFGLASEGSQRVEIPDFLNTIGGGIANRVGDRYGVQKPQGQRQAPPMDKAPPQFAGPVETGPPAQADFGTPQPPPSYGGMPSGPPMDPGQLEELRRRMGRGGGYQDMFIRRDR